MNHSQKKLSLFDLISHLSETHTDRWDEFQGVYSPFMVNRFLAMNDYTIGFVEMMNKYNLSPKEQYHFYLNVIPNKKRYFKYIKDKTDDSIESISKYYNVTIQRAKEYSKLLSNEEITDINSSIFQVG